ncbi:lipoprotein [Xanthobacter sp. KR7-225]|uniref:LPS translocon maturation chaperone LptM n=1 Tax=Xanthobacter sp. KR7-225 TaxID=3156613 RepID=UPI0032B4E9AF
MARLRSFDPAAAAPRAPSGAACAWPTRARLARAGLALAAVLVLAGCGVKGPLELPPGAQAAPAPPASGTGAPASADTSRPGAAAGAATNPSLIGAVGGSTGWQSGSTKNTSAPPEQLKGARRPEQPFILDGLL